MPDLPTCDAPSCTAEPKNGRLCWAHYKRLRKYGRYDLPTVMDRIRESVVVDAETGCWVWAKSLERNGYARMSVHGERQGVHRLAYESNGRTIPNGWHVDHLCRNRACCNPEHLEATTPRENIMRSPMAPAAINARKSHCHRGHPLSGGNLHISKVGGRACRKCSAIKTAAWRSRQKEAS